MHRRTTIRMTAGAVVAAALIAVAPATASPFTAGSDGLGDPFFPQAGKRGYLGNVPQEVAKLKEGDRGPIVIAGSRTLVH